MLFREDKMSALGGTFQVIIAVTLVILLFAIGFAVYNLETMRAVQDAAKQKRRVDIFTGVKDLVMTGEENYETRDDTMATYKDLALSVNQGSGAEFTYNFWMYLDRTPLGIDTAVADKQDTAQVTDKGLVEASATGATPVVIPDDIILLMRGNKVPVTYKNICGVNKTDIITKSPLIKLERNANVLTVEFNTVDAPDMTHESSRNTCKDNSTNWATMNNHKIAVAGLRSKPNLDKKWFMVSVIIQDTTPVDPMPIRNKVRCLIYINGVLELERYTDGRLVNSPMQTDPTVLLQNAGNLYVYPDVRGPNGRAMSFRPTGLSANAKGLMMADLSYFNYAITTDEITSLFRGGFTKTMAPSISQITSVDKNDIMTNLSLAPDKKQLVSF